MHFWWCNIFAVKVNQKGQFMLNLELILVYSLNKERKKSKLLFIYLLTVDTHYKV